jgi:hypothetical protein
MGMIKLKITMIHELDIGFFAATMRKEFERMGHEVCVIQGYKSYLDDETPKIDYLINEMDKLPLAKVQHEFAETDFFILRFLSDTTIKTLGIPKFAGMNNSIYKVHGTELRQRNIPYGLLAWHLEWYHNEPTVCGPRDWSLKDFYKSGVVTHIERPLDFSIIPKRVQDFPHAMSSPTNTYKKGTELLAEAWKNCPSEFPLQVVTGVTRKQCLAEKAKASLYIDRLGTYEHGPYGMNSAEAWHMKIPVFSQYRNWDVAFCADLPELVTNVNEFTLVENVKDFIENPKSYRKQTDYAYKYVKQVHDPKIIARQYIALAEEITRK